MVVQAVAAQAVLKYKHEDGTIVEYRVWNPKNSMLSAAIHCDVVRDIWMKPGAHVLYVMYSSATTLSHVSDIVGPTGLVYVVESPHRRAKELIEMSHWSKNIIPYWKRCHRSYACYRMMIDGLLDVVFSDVLKVKQAKTLVETASLYLRAGGHLVMYTKAGGTCSTLSAEAQIEELRKYKFAQFHTISLDPYDSTHAFVMGC
uniref:Fibrillarin n=1 Tax=Fagus sylvatica TaxID=28930 RepID=A0A2N9EYY2_FAGSY